MFYKYIIASTKGRCNYWHGVLLVNILLPVLLGLGFTQDGARWGMLSAIILLWAIGLLIAYYFAFLSTLIIRGGCLVAISQLLFGFHFYLGLIAVGVGERFMSPRPKHEYDLPTLNTFLSGFAASGFMGTVLMLVSATLGIVMIGIMYLIFDRSPTKHKLSIHSTQLPDV